MKVRIHRAFDGTFDLWCEDKGVIPGLTEHDLSVLEFTLAMRKAMSKRCEATEDEHICSLAPDHGAEFHLCRGCIHRWSDRNNAGDNNLQGS